MAESITCGEVSRATSLLAHSAGQDFTSVVESTPFAPVHSTDSRKAG